MSGLRRVRRFLVLLALGFGASLLLIEGVALHREYRAALARTSASAIDLSRIVEEYARRSFETSDLLTEAISDRVRAAGGLAALRDNPAAHEMLREMAGRWSGDYLTVFDADGIAVASSMTPDLPEVTVADRPWFQAHLAGAERHVGEALVGRISGEILFTYSRSLRRPDGSLDGVAQMAIHPGFFERIGFGTETASGTILALRTPDGRTIARTGLTAGDVGETLAGDPRLQRLLASPAGYIRSNATADGADRKIAWRRVTDWPAIVTVSVPVGSGLAPFRRALVGSLALTGGMLVALAAFTAFAIRLSRREEAAQAGLATAHAALLQARDGLEQRVAERTRDLAEANHRLRENEARFRGIFNATFQFISLLEPDGTLLESNETALAFIGRKPQDVVGRRFWETPWWRRDPTARDRLRDALRRAAAGEFIRYEVEVAGTGDTRALMDFSLKPVRDAAGAVVLLVAEGRDITALKSAEARLHAAQKLETLGQLTGGVAHDFNNLLMAVLGNLGLLRKRLPDDARLRRLLDGAVQGAERGAALTQRLLAFARRQELRPEAIDLARLTDGMADLLHRSLGPGIDLRIELPSHLPPVRADANQLEMALLNLSLNARDAMGGNGRLTIAARPAAPGEAEAPGDGPYLCITVTDTGTGMDAATLQRATEPFFTTKGPGKGSGLGLSMVHGLAAQSGGQLRLRSTPGEGTTVELWLPAADRGELAGEAAAASPRALAPMRPLSILVVDDDPLIQAGTAAMLEDLGHAVDIAASGPAALEALDRGGYGLMVTDFAMPGMNGLALIKAVRDRWHGLPIILATGFAELPEGERLDVPRLNKPYRQEDLAAAIATVIAAQPPDNVVPLPLGQRR